MALHEPSGRHDVDDLPTIGLDPAWVRRVFTVDGHQPAGVEFGGFVGTGQMSRVARFSLTWAQGGGPSTVLVKLPSSVASTRSMAFKRGPYLKECTFYRSVAIGLDLAAPRAFHVHYDGDGHDFAIVLEDVASHAPGDQLGGTSLADLAAALAQAAALHAGCWGRTTEDRFAVYREDLVAEVARTERTFPTMAEQVLNRWSNRVDRDVRAFVARLLPVIGEWRRLRSRPVTLVHGDFRPDNLLFDPSDPGRPVIVVDWQLSTVGPAAIDVAFLIGGALPGEQRRPRERELIATYLDALASRGVELETEPFLDEYAIASIQGVMVAISAAAMVDRTERGEELLSTMLDRHARHAIEWEAVDRVAAATTNSAGSGDDASEVGG